MKRELVRAIARTFDVCEKDVVGPAKFSFIMPARQALYKVLRMRGWTYADIGRFLRRDHTTIMSGCAHADRRMQDDPDYAEKVNRIAAMQYIPYRSEQ